MPSKKIGRYEIMGELGRGGMATVFLAFDPRFRREVALKVLPRHYLHDVTFRARFEREAQTVATLEHPAIVSVYDFGHEDEQPFLVMRYMRGGSLVDRIKAGPIPLQQAAEIFNRLAPALDYAHEHAIIHRDLKPQNILFDRWEKPYLADFGIVKLVEESVTDLTASGGAVGTPAYMSPEQVSGVDELDSRSDMYALGVILFEMLTGTLPYAARTPMSLALKHITEPVPNILEFNQSLPVESQLIIDRAMAKDREERYPTTAALAEAISELAKIAPGAQFLRPVVPIPVAQIPIAPDSLVELDEISEEVGSAAAVEARTATDAAIIKSVGPDTPTELEQTPYVTLPEEGSLELVEDSERIFPWRRILLIAVLFAVIIASFLLFSYSQALFPFASTTAAVALPTSTDASTAKPSSRTLEPTEIIEIAALLLSPTSTPTLEPSYTATASPTASLTPDLEPQASQSRIMSLTPDLEPQVPQFEILYSSVNVRSGPGTQHDAVAFLYEGDVVGVIGRTSDGSWFNIFLPDRKRAWISSTVGEMVDETDKLSIPIVATIPSPPERQPTATPEPTEKPPTATPEPTATAVSYGSTFTWIDPFQKAEQQRQLANIRALEPVALWASIIVLVVWLYWAFKEHVTATNLFNKWQRLKRLTQLLTEVLLAILLLWFFFSVGWR